MPALHGVGMALKPKEYGEELIGNEYCLSEIPDFQGLLPKAYDASVPVFALLNNEIRETGPILTGLIEKREQFRTQFRSLSDHIVKMMAYA